MIQAFRGLGHEVEEVALVDTETAVDDAARDAGDALWKRLAKRVPFAYDFLQLLYNVMGIPLLAAKLIGRRVDVIYERYSLFNFTGVAVARLFRVPIVLEVNSPFALEQKRDGHIRTFRFAQWTERVICNSATLVVAVSGPLKRILADAGVASSKLVVMPNGVNLDHFQVRTHSDGLRSSLGLQDKVVIGFIGWFRDWHGLDFLLKAFHQSGPMRDRAALLLIGDGPAMPQLRQYVEDNCLQASVIFTGPLPHHKVPPYLDLMDIAVQPGANEYCCPMKIIEYMALAKPIVAPRQENVEELLTEGSEALLFSPRDAASMGQALAELVNDSTRRAAMGALARAAIDRRGFTWTHNAQRVLEFVRTTSL
jgi:glycosyltransferase involved in cell wall biosynthesis